MLVTSFLLVSGAVSVLAANVDGANFCVGPYALCSTSYCQAIPGNDSYVTCACEGPFNGLNLGNTTCEARTQSLISTFSIKEEFTSAIQPPLYTFACEGSNAGPWATCLDAPCSTETGAVVCTCPLFNGSNFYLGESCPSSAAEETTLCAQLRSTGSTNSSLATLGSLFASFYGNPPKTPALCNATNTTTTGS